MGRRTFWNHNRMEMAWGMIQNRALSSPALGHIVSIVDYFTVHKNQGCSVLVWHCIDYYLIPLTIEVAPTTCHHNSTINSFKVQDYECFCHFIISYSVTSLKLIIMSWINAIEFVWNDMGRKLFSLSFMIQAYLSPFFISPVFILPSFWANLRGNVWENQRGPKFQDTMYT